MASITLTVTSAPNSLTLSGVKSLGAPADIVATAMPTSGQPIALGTLPAQPDGPYVMTTAVPPGSYTVQVSTGTTLASDTKSSSTVAPAILTVAGNNTLGFPADIVVTATPVAGGSPISIGTLANQPVGPYSMTANVPPGEYTVDTAMNVTLTGETTSTSTVSPATLTVTGNNTLGFPADILVTATPSAGGSPITLGTLTKQPVGCYSVTATVPPGDYTVETAMSATLSSEVQSSSSVSPASLTVTGNNTLGFPANIVVTATPAAGGNPITIATLSSQPVGPYSVTAFVPPGDYCVDSAMSVTLSNCVATQSTVAPTVLAVTGNNTLGLPANILVTATPVSGGGSITVGTLTDQPAGPYSLVTDAPPGDYTIDTTISVRLCGDEVASATVAPTVLTATGNNTLGFPADIAVTATSSVGGAPIMIGTLINQPVGAFAVTAVLPPGDYTVAAVLTATLSKPTQTAVCVPQTMLTVTGVKSLGVPADIVAVATPMGSGTPIALGTLCNQPDGPYVITATVPCGDYAVDVTSSATLCAAASCLAAVPAPALLSALITYNGNLYCFDQCSGSNLGNYTDPQGRFVQGCVRSTNVGLPGMTVFFRSDTDGSRDEVVFEYGNPFVTVTPINMTAYTVKITKGGATLATVSVPQHFWFARWRWQSAPRPVTTTPAALITAGLLPHYDASTLGVFAKTSPAYTYTPMTLRRVGRQHEPDGRAPRYWSCYRAAGRLHLRRHQPTDRACAGRSERNIPLEHPRPEYRRAVRRAGQSASEHLQRKRWFAIHPDGYLSDRRPSRLRRPCARTGAELPAIPADGRSIFPGEPTVPGHIRRADAAAGQPLHGERC